MNSRLLVYTGTQDYDNSGMITNFFFVLFSADLDALGSRSENTWNVLKCGAGEGWRRSVGPIV